MPGVTGRAWHSRRHGSLVHSQSWANVCLPDFRTLRVLGVSAGVPRLAYGGHRTAWDSPLVRPAEAVFPVSHVICSVTTAGFLSAPPTPALCPLLAGLGVGVTPPFRVMFFCPVLHVMSFKCDPRHGLSDEESVWHSASLSLRWWQPGDKGSLGHVPRGGHPNLGTLRPLSQRRGLCSCRAAPSPPGDCRGQPQTPRVPSCINQAAAFQRQIQRQSKTLLSTNDKLTQNGHADRSDDSSV